MKHKHCQIYFTSEVPFTKNGKSKAAIWKKADTIKDFFNLETLARSKADNSVKLLFDDEFLYLNLKSIIPESLYWHSDSDIFWNDSYFWLDLTSDKDKHMWITFNDKGEYHYFIEEEEITDSGIQFRTQTQKKKSTFEVEFNLTFPWKYLTKDIKKHSAINFNVSELRETGDALQREITSSTICSIINGKYIYRTGQLERKAKTAANVISARDTYLDMNRNITFTLNPGKAGPAYKNILGMNNSPRIKSEPAMIKENELFKRLGPARVRHHDAALTDPGFALIDVSRIFPLFKADHNDPECYDFGPTDLYLEQVVKCGVDIEFRFGESIEHSATRFRVKPPADTEKWAEICVNILRHYNEGWANGKKWNIKYASLWEEPDNKKLFDGPYEEFLKLYESFATKLKKAFPKLKVGGPQAIRLSSLEKLAAMCKEKSIPLDFLSCTQYARNPIDFANHMRDVRKLADKYGFKKAEVFLSEWNFCPRDWSNLFAERHVPMSMHHAAFCLASIISLQEVVDMAFFYLWASAGLWGLFSTWQEPYKVYFAFLFYTDFIRKKLKKIPITLSTLGNGLYHLAGIAKDGKIYMLVSQFRSPAEEFTIELPADYKKCTVKILSDTFPKGEGIKQIKSSGKGKFRFPLDAKVFGVYLMEFDKA